MSNEFNLPDPVVAEAIKAAELQREDPETVATRLESALSLLTSSRRALSNLDEVIAAVQSMDSETARMIGKGGGIVRMRRSLDSALAVALDGVEQVRSWGNIEMANLIEERVVKPLANASVIVAEALGEVVS